MKKIPMWRRYLTFWGRNVDRDIEGELRFHLEMRTRELIDRGMDPNEARFEARRAFGDIRQVRSECNDIGKGLEADMRRTEHYDRLKQDLSFGLRQLNIPDSQR
jgi:putative ABC transport system permease protein